ncbi:MAG: hypothetical protein HWD59_14715 [Coxiellaceae bacterium]|nr:MAG: hypothetical protein HWD59_14715 [Coxiellaceae bacterium]
MEDNNQNEQTLPLPSKNPLFNKAWYAYVNSPCNLSTLTGWRYPGIPRLKGNPLLGRLPSF